MVHQYAVSRIIRKHARLLGIHLKSYANVGNHLHMVIILPSLRVWRDFIRTISGLIARLVLKAERGSARGVRFWTGRPWTRLVAWGRDLRGVTKYLTLNTLEAFGFSRKSFDALKKLNIEDIVLKRQRGP